MKRVADGKSAAACGGGKRRIGEKTGRVHLGPDDRQNVTRGEPERWAPGDEEPAGADTGFMLHGVRRRFGGID